MVTTASLDGSCDHKERPEFSVLTNISILALLKRKKLQALIRPSDDSQCLNNDKYRPRSNILVHYIEVD